MRNLLAVMLMAIVTRASDADPIPWPKPKNDRARIEADGTLVVEGGKGRTNTSLLVLEKPEVPSHHYRLVGRIKYEHVAGDGYVEMWNKIPDKGDFFSKTLAPSGPLGKVTGTSDWRELQLPFFSEPNLLPERLTVNLVLPGAGKVWITPLTLQKAPSPGGR